MANCDKQASHDQFLSFFQYNKESQICINVFTLFLPQAPLVSPGRRASPAIQEEEDQMGLLVCLQVLGVLEPKVRERNISVFCVSRGDEVTQQG